MNKTTIEWVRNPDGSQGYTLNSKTGCRNHTPEGLCLGGGFPCYAYKLANGRLKSLYLANTNVAFPDADSRLPTLEEARVMVKDPFYPRFWPERLEQPYQHIKKSVGIFLDDMSDWMGDYWPEEWTRQELHVMEDCPQHRFYTLTKQPQNLIKFSPFPENCWVGVTATNQDMFERGIYHLRQIKASVLFMSFEPLLEQIKSIDIGIRELNWVIIGAQTKPTVYPKFEWVEEIVKACDKAGIPVFLKDNLRPLLVDALAKKLIDRKQFFVHSIGHGGDLRQEIPK